MKNVTFFAYLLFIVSSSFFTGCTPENVDYLSTTKETITRAQWSVDYYFQGQDKTAQFNNFKLSFVGNGTLTASDGTNLINGEWNMLTDVNRNNILRISIKESPLQDLNDQWTISRTSTDFLIMKGITSELHLRRL